MSAITAAIAADTAVVASAPLQAEVTPPAPVEPQPTAVEPQQPTAPEVEPQATPAETPSTEQTAEAAKPEGQDDDFTLDPDQEPETSEQQKPAEGAVDGDGEQIPDADGEIGKLLATSRGKRIYASFKKDQFLAKTPEDGGIGHVPTAEQVKQYYQTYADAEAMHHDFETGNTRNFAAYWFGADQNGAPRAASAENARALMEVLPEINQEAYMSAAEPVIHRFISGMYHSAMTDPTLTDEQRQDWLTAAQFAEFRMTGKYRTVDQLQTQAQPQQTRHPAEVELERLRRQMADRDKQAFGQQAQDFTTRVESAVDRDLQAMCEKALDRIKPTMKPLVYEALRDKFLAEVKQDVAKNREGLRLYEIAKDRALRSRSEQDMAELRRIKRQLASPAIIAHRPKYISQGAEAAKADADARHAQLQRTQSMTAPTGTQTPVQRDLSQALTRNPGESRQDFLKRQIAHDTGTLMSR